MHSYSFHLHSPPGRRGGGGGGGGWGGSASDPPEGGAKHGGMALDVQAKPAVLVLVVAQVPYHLPLVLHPHHLGHRRCQSGRCRLSLPGNNSIPEIGRAHV